MNKSDKGELELLRLYRGLNPKGRGLLLSVAHSFCTNEGLKAGTDFDAYQKAMEEKAAKEVDAAGAGDFLRLIGDEYV